MIKFNIILFDAKQNIKSESLGECYSQEEADEEIEKLRKEGLPAFWEKEKERK